MLFMRIIQNRLGKTCHALNRVPKYFCLSTQLNCAKLLFTRTSMLTDLNAPVNARSIMTTPCVRGLEEFFDNEENYGQSEVVVGRPWKIEELRIKSNTELHKLWYVLLKERNMLLTMEQLYADDFELFPSPERIFKVEESMENILEVIKERDDAYSLLETGHTTEPETVEIRNFLGLKYQRQVTEHSVPRKMNRMFNLLHQKYDPYLDEYFKLHFEKVRKREYREKVLQRKYKERLLKEFPNLKDDEEFMADLNEESKKTAIN